MYKKSRFKEGWLKAAAFALVAAAIVVPVISASAAGDDPTNNIVYNGCTSRDACVSAMRNGDGHGHSGADITSIDNYFGLTQNTLKNDTFNVTVNKDGNVFIDQNGDGFKSGDLIGTNAVTVGRTKITNANGTSTYISAIGVWERTTQVSFASGSLTGYARITDGNIDFILNACGNVGHATPKPASKTPTPKPPTPKPTPKPTKTPTPKPPTPMPPTPMPPTPTPSTPVATPVECVGLSATQVPNSPSEFTFTIDQQPENATDVTGYMFTLTDTDNNTSTPIPPTGPDMPSTTQTLAPGNWTMSGQIMTSDEGTTSPSQACSASVSIATPATPPPATPPPGQVLSASTPLPDTGAGTSALGGALGLTGIGAASRAYLRSRKSLFDSLRNKR